MLKTVKSVILAITITGMIVSSTIASSCAIKTLRANIKVTTEYTDTKIETFAENTNKDITLLQTDVEKLALIGKLFYESHLNSPAFLDYQLEEFFKIKKIAIGGGIWFNPYTISKNEKNCFSYAYLKDDKIYVDKNYQKHIPDGYSGLQWFKSLKYQFNSSDVHIAWTEPYVDKFGTHELMTTVGTPIVDRNHKTIGIATIDWPLHEMLDKIEHFKITKNSFALLIDTSNDFILATSCKEDNQLYGQSLQVLPWYNKDLKNAQIINSHGKKHIVFIKDIQKPMRIIVSIPIKELYMDTIRYFLATMLTIYMTCIIMFLIIHLLLRKFINRPVEYLTSMAKKISKGNLDVEIKLENFKEYTDLAKSLNTMKKDIQSHIRTEEQAMKEKDLWRKEIQIATEIQNSALPQEFTSEKTNNLFDIYAIMDPMLEVGGDFYDFFFIDDKKLVYLIADVSEKGVPAALCMMSVKSTIQDFAKMGMQPTELLAKLNNKVCEQNSNKFFVTLLIAITDITDGSTVFLNAGHNKPLVKIGENNSFEYLNDIPTNLVLGIKKDICYKTYETILKPNDILFFYTDGITEAMTEDKHFYGEDRLQNLVNQLHRDNKMRTANLKDILSYIREDVRTFSGDAEQSDDITMLAFRYKFDKNNENNNLNNNMNNNLNISINNTYNYDKNSRISGIINNDMRYETITLIAKEENLEYANYWIKDLANKLRLSQENILDLKLIIEELFVNVCDYAYTNVEDGIVQIDFARFLDQNELELIFNDNGAPFNPLEEIAEANREATTQQRMSDGFGFAIVKNIAKDIKYEYTENQNRLTLKLNII